MSEARQFATDAPCVRIWSAVGSTIERTIMWDMAANGYHVDGYNWDREDEAAPTIVQSRKVYPHVAGYRLHAIISFAVYRPGIAPHRGTAASITTGFTENDLAALDNALKAGQDIEFYLHGLAMNSSKFSSHLVQHHVTRSERGDGNWIHLLTIEFTGTGEPAATRPAEL
jgi:hypothetical protein